MLAQIALMLAVAGQTPAEDARTIEVELTVAGDPQVAVWLEDADGAFVDTIMVTRLVGSYGLGNRPGRPDFGGGYLWPYGRREMTLPVWAHRRGVEYDRLVFQDCKEDWLGWHEIVSSHEPFYCRPMTEGEMSVDTITCPTTRFATDKGVPLGIIRDRIEAGNGGRYDRPECRDVLERYDDTTVYPPRNDITSRDSSGHDWSGVGQLREMNDLDAVSRATPRAMEPQRLSYGLPATLVSGDYVVWVEVNQQYDANAHHSYAFYEDPRLSDYGIPNVGQPSLVWKVPLSVTSTVDVGTALDYDGYGSPTGEDGDLRPPDDTISENVPGSGVNRLIVTDDESGSWRVRATYQPKAECDAPRPVSDLRFEASTWNSADISFVPEDPKGEVASYEVKYEEGVDAIESLEDFMAATPASGIPRGEHGQRNDVTLDMPRDATVYTVAIRALNHCGQASEFVTLEVETEERIYATVDACFVATAAYGSLDEGHVVTLRRFRDDVLMTNAGGRALVDLYYASSPPMADAIRERPWARAAARAALSPLVWLVRAFE